MLQSFDTNLCTKICGIYAAFYFPKSDKILGEINELQWVIKRAFLILNINVIKLYLTFYVYLMFQPGVPMEIVLNE